MRPPSPPHCTTGLAQSATGNLREPARSCQARLNVRAVNREDASSRYVRPVVADYGDLARITADVSIFTGQGHTTDLSFSHPGGAAGAAGMGGAGGDSRVAPAGIVPGHLEASGASAPPHAHGGAGDTLGAVESLGGG